MVADIIVHAVTWYKFFIFLDKADDFVALQTLCELLTSRSSKNVIRFIYTEYQVCVLYGAWIKHVRVYICTDIHNSERGSTAITKCYTKNWSISW